MEIKLEGKRVILRPLNEKNDLPILFKWRNETQTLYLWSTRRHLVSWETFLEEFRADFERDKHIQLMIENKRGETIGTIYSYNPQFVDGNVFITTYIDLSYLNKGCGVETVVLFINYLFSYFNFQKIYFDVYAFNELSYSSLRGAGFVEEGRFKEHRFWNGKFHDLIRLTIFRERLEEIRNFINRLSNAKK